jgi:hypothetical protein
MVQNPLRQDILLFYYLIVYCFTVMPGLVIGLTSESRYSWKKSDRLMYCRQRAKHRQ